MSAAVYRSSPSTWRPSRMPSAFDRLDQRRGHAAPGGELFECERAICLGGRITHVPPGGRHGGREVGVGRAQLAGDHAPDRCEREPLALERTDLGDALDVLGAVPGHATFPLGSGEQPARLVVAHRVDRHVARRGQLFHAVPHDRTLYESALRRSSRGGRATMRRDEPRARDDQPRRGPRVRDRHDGAGRRDQGPVCPRRVGRPSSVPPALLHRRRAAARHRATPRLSPALPRRLRAGRGSQLRRVPGHDDVRDAARRHGSPGTTTPRSTGSTPCC